jgi:hypothetical protein
MKLNSVLAIASVLFGSQFVSQASTVTFSAVPTARVFSSEAGVALTTSSSVWVGTFANDSLIAGALNSSLSVSANVAAITAAAGWDQFGFNAATDVASPGATFTMDLNGSGRIGGSVQDNTANANFFTSAKNLYLWVFNADTIGAATEMGIFRSTDATVPWTFPTNGLGVGDTTTYSLTAAAAPTLAAVGGVGSMFSATAPRLEVFGVPEPSRLMLLVFGLIGLISRRCR